MEALGQGNVPSITCEDEWVGSWDDVVERTHSGSEIETHAWQAKSGAISEKDLLKLIEDLLAHPEITRATLVLAHWESIDHLGKPAQLAGLLQHLAGANYPQGAVRSKPDESWWAFLQKACREDQAIRVLARRLEIRCLGDEEQIKQQAKDTLSHVYERPRVEEVYARMYELVGRTSGLREYTAHILREKDLKDLEPDRLQILPTPQKEARQCYLKALSDALEGRRILKGLLSEKTTVAEAWTPLKVVPFGASWNPPTNLKDAATGLHFVVGEAGSGKTELLAATARELAGGAFASQEAPLPLFFEVRELVGSEDKALCEAAERLAPGVSGALAVLLRSPLPRWTILADGLDEAPKEGPAKIDALRRRFPGASLIVSTRPGFEDAFGEKNVYSIEPWTPAEAIALFGKLGMQVAAIPPTQIDVILDGGTLLERPLMATLAAFALRQGEPPRTRTGLLAFVARKLLQAWPGWHGRMISWHELARPIRKFALASLRDEKYVISRQNLARMAHQFASDDEERFEEALWRDLGLLAPKDSGYVFTLRPLAEFLAGQELKALGDEEVRAETSDFPRDKHIRHAARHAWGAEPVRYAVGLLLEEKESRRAGRLLLGLSRPLKGDVWRLVSLRRLLAAIYAAADSGDVLKTEAYPLAKAFARNLCNEDSPWRADHVAAAIRGLARNGGPCWEALRDIVGLAPSCLFFLPQIAHGEFLLRCRHSRRVRPLPICSAGSPRNEGAPPTCGACAAILCIEAPLLPRLTDPRTPAQFYRGLPEGVGNTNFWLEKLLYCDAEVREEAVNRLSTRVNTPRVQGWLFCMLQDIPWPGIPESCAAPALAAGLALRKARRTPRFKANLAGLLGLVSAELQLGSAAAAIAIRPQEASPLLLAKALHMCAHGGYPVPRLPIDELAATKEGEWALNQVWDGWRSYAPSQSLWAKMSLGHRGTNLPIPLSVLAKRRLVGALLPACLRRSQNEKGLAGLLHFANASSLLHDVANRPEVLASFLDEYPALLLRLPPRTQDQLGRALGASATLRATVQRQWMSIESQSPHLFAQLPGRALEPLVSAELDNWSALYARWLPGSSYEHSLWGEEHPSPHVFVNAMVAATANEMVRNAWMYATEGRVDEKGRRTWLAPIACAGILEKFSPVWGGRHDIFEMGLAWIRSPDVNNRNGGSLLLRRALLSDGAKQDLAAAIKDALDNRIAYDQVARPNLVRLIRSQSLALHLQATLLALIRPDEDIAINAAVALLDVLRGEEAAAVARKAAHLGLGHFAMEVLSDGDLARLIALAPTEWKQATMDRIRASSLGDDSLARLLPAFDLKTRRHLLDMLLRSGEHEPLPWRRKDNWGLPYRPLERVLELAFDAGLNARQDGIFSL